MRDTGGVGGGHKLKGEGKDGLDVDRKNGRSACWIVEGAHKGLRH